MNQRTLKHPISLTGIALNSGKPVNVVISPAPPNTSIKFFTSFGNSPKMIKSNCQNITGTSLSTDIGDDTNTIHTIEHLMSALHGHHIDNAIISLSGGNEVPILDGSSEPWYSLIQSAGYQEQNEPRRFTEVTEPIIIKDKTRWIKIEPYDGLIIDCTIFFAHCKIREQRIVFDMDKYNYYKDISRARTFGFYDNLIKLKDAGYLKGGDESNAIILNKFMVLNEPLRYEDEFVRHKLLDLIGDIYLNGAIKGYITSYCSGHDLNNRLMRAIDEQSKEIPYRKGYAKRMGQRVSQQSCC